MKPWRRKLFELIHGSVARIGTDYNKNQVIGLLRAIFDIEYPPELLHEHLSKEDADELARAKAHAADEAADFVEKHFRDGASVILLMLVMIGWREGKRAMVEYLAKAKDGRIPAPPVYHNVRGYKRWASLLMNKLIDFLRLSRNKGGRPKDESLMSAIESAFSELAQSEEEVSQEGIEKYLRRKTGKPISQEAARKRLIRKGKTVSEAKGKKRKPRKKK